MFSSEIEYYRPTERHLDLRILPEIPLPQKDQKIDHLYIAISKEIRNASIQWSDTQEELILSYQMS